MQQFKLDFNAPCPVEDEKKTELISFRIGGKLKSDLEYIAQAKKCNLSELCHEYLARCYVEDYKTLSYIEIHGKKTLRELCGKF